MPPVSILVPCYQEREFIGPCLGSILASELPPETTIEVLVLDGMSTDGTREIVADVASRDSRVRLLDNPARFQASALNIGIEQSRGEYIVRMDAHAEYPPQYLRHCVETAIRTKASNVGGCVETQARGPGYQAALVQALTTHRFGVGNSGFRTGTVEGEVDTVPYGCFRRDIFDTVGLFDERLVRAQDYEMNRRIAAAGGQIWLNPSIQARYYQQPTLVAFYWKQIVKEAPYNAYMWYLAPYTFSARHAITGVFSAGVIGGMLFSGLGAGLQSTFMGVMALYTLLAVASAVQQSVRYQQPLHVLVLPVCFFVYHFLHGVGLLAGLSRLLLGVAPVQGGREPWPGAGRLRAWPPRATGNAENAGPKSA